MPNGDVSLNIYIAIVLIGAIGYGIWSGFFALGDRYWTKR